MATQNQHNSRPPDAVRRWGEWVGKNKLLVIGIGIAFLYGTGMTIRFGSKNETDQNLALAKKFYEQKARAEAAQKPKPLFEPPPTERPLSLSPIKLQRPTMTQQTLPQTRARTDPKEMNKRRYESFLGQANKVAALQDQQVRVRERAVQAFAKRTGFTKRMPKGPLEFTDIPPGIELRKGVPFKTAEIIYVPTKQGYRWESLMVENYRPGKSEIREVATGRWVEPNRKHKQPFFLSPPPTPPAHFEQIANIPYSSVHFVNCPLTGNRHPRYLVNFVYSQDGKLAGYRNHITGELVPTVPGVSKETLWKTIFPEDVPPVVIRVPLSKAVFNKRASKITNYRKSSSGAWLVRTPLGWAQLPMPRN